jgi:hypothetical protein
MDLSLWGQSRKAGERHRAALPVLAPGTALRSRPRVALSSAQALSVYWEPRPPHNSRLGYILANRGERILLDLRAETRMGQGNRPEKDCREISRAISVMYIFLFNGAFAKGALSATGLR